MNDDVAVCNCLVHALVYSLISHPTLREVAQQNHCRVPHAYDRQYVQLSSDCLSMGSIL
jgi:hypothetical protein